LQINVGYLQEIYPLVVTRCAVHGPQYNKSTH